MASNAPSDPAAMERLAKVLADSCMDIAELMADAEETRFAIEERAMAIRENLRTVSKMAGLGDLPELRIERKVRRVG